MNSLSTCRRMTASRFAIVAALFGLALASLAETPVPHTRGKATIDFPFIAGPTLCPAGSYAFESDGTKVTLRSTDPNGPSVIMLILTHLGRHDRDSGPEFVFDKVEDQMKLSEIWPSKQDGYLVLLSPQSHAHRVVGGSNPHD